MHAACVHKPHTEASCVHKPHKDKKKSCSGNKKLDYIMSYITMCSMYNMDINVDKKYMMMHRTLILHLKLLLQT